MKIKTVLKALGFAVLSLLVLLITVAGVIWMKPSLLINDTTLAYGANWLRENTGIDITYDEIKADSASPSFWVKSFSIGGENICQHNPDFIVRGCISELELGAELDLEGFGLKINRIDEAVLRTQGLIVDLRSDEPQEFAAEKETGEPINPEALREMVNSFLEATKIGRVGIAAEDVKILTNELDLKVNLHAEKVQDDRGEPVLKLAIEEETIRGELNQHAQLKGELSSAGPNFTGHWTLDTQLNFVMPGTLSVNTKLAIKEQQAESFGYALEGRVTLPTPATPGPDNIIDVTTEGETNLSQIEGSLRVVAKNFLPENVDLLARNCRYSGAIPYLIQEGSFDLGCQLVVPTHFADRWTQRVRETGDLTFPTQAVVQVDASVENQLFANTGQEGTASVVAELAPWKEGYLGVEAKVAVQARGQNIMDFANLEITPRVDAKIQVESFQKLVAALSDTPYAIPAPLNVLKGSVTFASEGEAAGNMEQFRMPLKLQTRLSSQEQVLNTTTSGLMTYSPSAKAPQLRLNIDSLLEKVQVRLPDIDPLAGIPALTPDPRMKSLKGVPLHEIVPEEKKDQGPGFFAYDVNVRTKNPRSLELKSNLLEGVAPIAVNLKLSSQKGMTGYVSVHDAEVEYLRRSAKIQKLTLSFPQKKEAPQEIDGLVTTTQQDVDVFIELKGTVSNPQFVMWSNPDLPPDSIVALLLFNRPVDQLTNEESTSAGQAADAIADGAIGILGMWAFASTPVQSVAYNPETKVYSASVDIGKGASLTVGSDWEQTQTVQLRKRLAPDWILTTSVEPNRAGTKDVGEMVLQWQNRY